MVHAVSVPQTCQLVAMEGGILNLDLYPLEKGCRSNTVSLFLAFPEMKQIIVFQDLFATLVWNRSCRSIR